MMGGETLGRFYLEERFSTPGDSGLAASQMASRADGIQVRVGGCQVRGEFGRP